MTTSTKEADSEIKYSKVMKEVKENNKFKGSKLSFLN
jgi:hypothetical protein